MPRRRNPMPTMGALFITNPKRKNPMATRRRNGLALKRNTSRAAYTLRAEGKSGGKAAVAKFKKLTKAAQDSRFKKAGGAKGLAAWRAGSSARKAGSKTWWASNKPSWHPDYKAPAKKKAAPKRASRKVAASGKKKIVVAKNGRKMHYIGGKLVSKAAYSAKSNPRMKSSHRSLAMKRNGTKKGQVRKTARRAYKKNSFGGFALRSNPMSTGIMPVDMVAGAVDKVPLVGRSFAPFVAPIAVGAASGAGVFYLTNLIEPKLPEKVQPYAFSVAGILGAVVVMKVPAGSLTARRIVAAAMATVGAGVDMYRHLYTKEAEVAFAAGDASMDEMMMDEEGLGAWDYEGGALNGYGALALKENPGYGALALKENSGYGAWEYGDAEEGAEEYTDAEMVDAGAAGTDFDATEGKVLVMGPKAWFKHFGRPGKRMYHRTRGTYSRHAGKQGHRWAWMIKLVGFKGARYVAGLQPHQRMLLIQQLKAQAKASIQAHSGNILPDAPSVFESMGAQGAHGYGATGGSYGATAYMGGDL
jgi:hypothetical protein